MDNVVVSNDFVVSYDTCSGKNIVVNGTCQLKIGLVGAGKSGIIEAVLSYAGKDLNLSGEVITVNSGGGGNFVPNIIFTASSFDMGSLASTESKQLIVNIKNTGTLNAASSTASVDNSNFSVLYNQCINKSLAINETCQVKIVLSAVGKLSGNYSTNLSFGGKTQNITGKINGVSNYKTVNFVLETKDGIPLDPQSFTSEIEYFNLTKDGQMVSLSFFGLGVGYTCESFPSMSRCKFKTYEVDPETAFSVSSGYNWYPQYYGWYYGEAVGYKNIVGQIGAEIALFKDNVEVGILGSQLQNSFSYIISQDTKFAYVIRCHRNSAQDVVSYDAQTGMCVHQ